MSEPKLISPLLDGFAIGAPMSSRSGVCCCPAIKENSDKRYIVKIISIPASQVQLDALLLTKAYKDPADALEYFKSQADSILEEAAFLGELSKLEGFLPYEDWQIVPMKKNELGYDVYLLSPYRRSLEKHMRRRAMTHLDAVNLGLDLCAALSVCRRSGRICADLKPSNVFVSQEKEYRIGDLGFVPMDALRYTSLPDRCRSPYMPPETRDLLGTLNDTVDTYAVGMILYQLYNGGNLPDFPEDPAQPLPKPQFASEEMAQILQKACAPKPEDRWNNPIDMGQALVSYMQRCTVNDTPIVPQPEEAASDTAASPPEGTSGAPEGTSGAPEETIDFTMIPAEKPQDQRTAETWEIVPEGGTEILSPDSEEEPVPPETPEPPPPQEDSAEEGPASTQESPSPKEEQKLPPRNSPTEQGESDPEPEDLRIDSAEEDTFSRELEELNQLLRDGTETKADTSANARKSVSGGKPTPPPKIKQEKKHSGGHKVLVTLLILFLLAAFGFGGFTFYHYYYLQTVDSLHVDGTQNQITVTVKTTVDASAITVTCTDIFGKTMRSPLNGDQAFFTDLSPDSLYKIQLETTGFHKLTGQISDIFTTDPITEIVDISAVTGPEDGSVLLSMTVKGNDPEAWTVTCFAEGEENITQDFTGHNVTVKGLTVGKTYSFQIGTVDGTQLVGNTLAEFTASSLVMAKDLAVTAHNGSSLTVRWTPPEEPVDLWTVRCYGGGYDEYQEVTGNEVTFDGINETTAYTVEVTADGMTQSARLSVSANPVNITGFHVSENSEDRSLQVSWEYDGTAPQGGWLLMYSIDGNTTQNIEETQNPAMEITPIIPGAAYTFTVSSPDSISVFNDVHTYTANKAKVYSGHAITGYKITAKSLVTPAAQGWNQSTITNKDYTSTFTLGQSISLVLQASVNFYLDKDDIDIMYVVRDSDGKVIPGLLGQETKNWHSLWSPADYHFCELTLPHVPDIAGSYTVDVYFDGQSVVSVPFTMERST